MFRFSANRDESVDERVRGFWVGCDISVDPPKCIDNRLWKRVCERIIIDLR